MTNPNQGDSYKERIPQDTCINERSSLQGKTLYAQEQMSTLYYSKNPKILTNQGTHNFPQLWHFRIVKGL